MSCDSWDSNAPFDVVPVPAPDDHLNPVGLYLGEDMEKYLTHPYASPLFGDFKGLPPMLIQAGDSEVLRDEITLLAHKATLAGVHVQYELYEDCVGIFGICVQGAVLTILLYLSGPCIPSFPFLRCRPSCFHVLPRFCSRCPTSSPNTLAQSTLRRKAGA